MCKAIKNGCTCVGLNGTWFHLVTEQSDLQEASMWESKTDTSKISHCVLEQLTLPSLFRTGWFQERIWGRFNNCLKEFRALWKIDLNVKIAPSLNIVKTKIPSSNLTIQQQCWYHKLGEHLTSFPNF